ncbi:MAG: hypothetical protein LBD27_03120 [Tannerella sp.]|jgi:hypothetical protein|nr:hypothetical protein [Tannerella sp.]
MSKPDRECVFAKRRIPLEMQVYTGAYLLPGDVFDVIPHNGVLSPVFILPEEALTLFYIRTSCRLKNSSYLCVLISNKKQMEYTAVFEKINNGWYFAQHGQMSNIIAQERTIAKAKEILLEMIATFWIFKREGKNREHSTYQLYKDSHV